jgi:hypothetical protein
MVKRRSVRGVAGGRGFSLSSSAVRVVCAVDAVDAVDVVFAACLVFASEADVRLDDDIPRASIRLILLSALSHTLWKSIKGSDCLASPAGAAARDVVLAAARDEDVVVEVFAARAPLEEEAVVAAPSTARREVGEQGTEPSSLSPPSTHSGLLSCARVCGCVRVGVAARDPECEEAEAEKVSASSASLSDSLSATVTAPFVFPA